MGGLIMYHVDSIHPSILINATNIHVGGGVQVASSFISELATIIGSTKQNNNISILCSSQVESNLPTEFDRSVFCSFNVLNVYGLKKISNFSKTLFDGYDTCFTVFGPFYLKLKVKKHICGFAQPWIAYPNNDAYSKLPFVNRLKNNIKFKVQSFYFKQYEQLVVEQMHVKEALGNIGYKKDKISVVSNCVSTVYNEPDLWKSLNFDKSKLKYSITLGFIGRAYSHKNISILKAVDQLLSEKYKLKCNFVFTFTEDEMKNCGFYELDNFFSVGTIKIAQCPKFYQLLDALVFPSLLECFSASPIEAMKMRTTVIASNYPFVTEVCQDAAFYFDALDINSIADTIADALSNGTLMEEKKELGLTLVKGLPTAKERAFAYLNIINN